MMETGADTKKSKRLSSRRKASTREEVKRFVLIAVQTVKFNTNKPYLAKNTADMEANLSMYRHTIRLSIVEASRMASVTAFAPAKNSTKSYT